MINIQHLTKQFNHQTVFEDLNLQIDTGEVVGIIGPSGAGKSTLLRCLNLLETPDAGSIQINDQKFVAPKIADRDKIKFRQETSMVFQQFNLFRQKTVLENVTEGLITVQKRSKAEAETIARTQIEAVGLTDRIDYYPQQLSGGQKQRVGIARSLAMQPNILLLDEPTSALDTELVDEVLITIQQVVETQKNLTVIIISHELSFIRDVASRIVVFDVGGIVEQGTPTEIFTTPKKERTKQFLQSYQRQALTS
ncbi:amino acid ABC transporter ATP-binding protein [Agrilactobacillus composti]|uniref:amino acid ABC transporter ATP-binding protein n=1 Tax=Agrilactobacillus composti TaxID=398555 RepID=UPI00055491BA|nr:amino acid ABC transporter ATP-binding protein [Agrilactobacillus composti]